MDPLNWIYKIIENLLLKGKTREKFQRWRWARLAKKLAKKQDPFTYI